MLRRVVLIDVHALLLPPLMHCRTLLTFLIYVALLLGLYPRVVDIPATVEHS